MLALSHQHSCTSPEQKLGWFQQLYSSQLCHTPDEGFMLHGQVHRQVGRHGEHRGCAPPSTADDSSCSGPIRRAAQEAPAGLPTASNFYRMEPLLQTSADPLPCILLARCCTRHCFTFAAFSTHNLPTSAPEVQTQ